MPIALVFPNQYRLGMSNLGFQLVYDLLNQEEDIVCERLFLPPDLSVPLSVESGRPLRDFPFVFFSVSFEQDFVSLVRIFELSSIKPLSRERRQDKKIAPGHPLVVCGGVVTFINPEPLAPFIDLFIVGEAEPVLSDLAGTLVQAAQQRDMDRDGLLHELVTELPGCYVPEMYEMHYDQSDRLIYIDQQEGAPARVKKVDLASLEVASHSTILTPDAEFADLYLTELGRGCSRGCRFCAAGFVYRPPRLWPAAAIINGLSARPENVQRIGLLGMEMARQEDLAAVASYLLRESCTLSFSSLRADAIGPELLSLLAKSGLKSAAIAPDGGSERLRHVINKGLGEDELLWAAEVLVKAGVTNLKLYFMIGLPTETWDDLEELIQLTMKIKKTILAIGRARGKLATLTLSVNPFVPKAWTPFQFCAFNPISILKKKIGFIRKKLKHEHNIRILADKVENTLSQAVLARGDRRLGEILLHVVREGGNWQHVFKRHDIDVLDYVRKREASEVFCWEVIDPGVSREYLWYEYQKAYAGRKTSPCQPAKCKRCGVCHGK